jgi:prophage regulatory protein
MDLQEIPSRLLTGRQIYGPTGITSLSRSSIYEGVRAGWFPKPLRLSPNRVAWVEAEVLGWIASCRRLGPAS